MATKKVIIDNRMRQIEKQKLQNMGFEIIEVQTNPNVYTEISSHVDISVCKIENEIIVEPTQNMNNISNKIYGKERISAEYPHDIKYNVSIPCFCNILFNPLSVTIADLSLITAIEQFV